MEKIKQFIEGEKGKQVFLVLVLILVGFATFQLGRLSKENGSTGVKIEYNGVSESANVLSALGSAKLLVKPTPKDSTPVKTINNFFASKKGKKYYPVNCSAGKTIKQENRVYFDTRELAEKAGYTLSSSCR